MTILLGVVAFAYVIFVLYLSYVTLRVAHDNGKLAAAPVLVRGVCWSIFGVMLAADVVFNFTVGTVLFLRLPEVKRPTFTQRCKKHLEDDDYRGRLARFVRDGWLNPFEPGHL